MKYLVFSLLLLNLTACSLWNPFGPKIEEKNTTDIIAGSGQTTQSGALTTDKNDTVSPSDTNNATMTGSTDSSTGGSTATSSGQTSTGSANQDSEVQSITDDIDKIFDDIAKESK